MKTYKKKIEISIPIGWEFVRLGQSEMGDNYINSKGNVTKHIASGWFPHKLRIIVTPKVKTGQELLHCLVGYSDDSIDKAKEDAINGSSVGIVNGYNLSQNRSYRINNNLWRYAYPVPAEKLDELKAKLTEK